MDGRWDPWFRLFFNVGVSENPQLTIGFKTKPMDTYGYPLVMTNIAIENCPFIVDLPIEDGDFQ